MWSLASWVSHEVFWNFIDMISTHKIINFSWWYEGRSTTTSQCQESFFLKGKEGANCIDYDRDPSEWWGLLHPYKACGFCDLTLTLQKSYLLWVCHQPAFAIGSYQTPYTNAQVGRISILCMYLAVGLHFVGMLNTPHLQALFLFMRTALNR